MPALIILSPFTTSINDVSLPINSTGIAKVSSMFCWANIGKPAVTLPKMGISTTSFLNIFISSSNISIALGFVGSRLIKPFFSSLSR